MKNKKTKKGFSLIELVLVIAIISLATAAIYISMRSGRVETELELAAREVVSNLRKLQNNAISGKQISNSDNPTYKTCGFAMKYGINGTNLATNYQLEYYSAAVCPGDAGVQISDIRVDGNAIQLNKSSKRNVIAFGVPGPLGMPGEKHILFYGIYGGVFKGNGAGFTKLGALETVQLILANNVAGKAIDICIDSSGAIIEGSVRGVSDPSTC